MILCRFSFGRSLFCRTIRAEDSIDGISFGRLIFTEDSQNFQLVEIQIADDMLASSLIGY